MSRDSIFRCTKADVRGAFLNVRVQQCRGGGISAVYINISYKNFVDIEILNRAIFQIYAAMLPADSTDSRRVDHPKIQSHLCHHPWIDPILEPSRIAKAGKSEYVIAYSEIILNRDKRY